MRPEIKEFMEALKAKTVGEAEFHQAVEEVIETSRKQKSTFKICNIQKKVLLFQIICFDC